MKSDRLTKAQEQILRDQVITADQPGTVLLDFRTLLEFLAPAGVEAGGKYHLLPIKIIDELDGRLSHPLRFALQRPQIRSHPYIQGLNLLLRATGLAQVRRSGPKARLVLDPTMLEQWDRLNPTEQYFQLLEAWLRVGRAEMIGETAGFGGKLIWSCIRAWNVLPAKGVRLDFNKSPATDYVPGFYREFYHLALMDLFGLYEVEHFSRPITPWRPARVQYSPFGDAVLCLLLSRINPLLGADFPEGADEDEPDTDRPRYGVWQPLFQPYFPEWRRNLEFPRVELRTGEFLFKVSLGKIWRRFAMPANSTLGDLMSLILRSVNFDSDHLYEFRYTDRLGAEVSANSPWMDEGPWADEIQIGSLPLEPGQEMKLTYDFGDCWKFAVKLEKIEETSQRGKKPRLLETHGQAPEQYPNWDDE